MDVEGALKVLDLDVSGNASFNSVDVEGALNVLDLEVSGNASFNSMVVDGILNVLNLDVSGNASFNSVDVEGALNVLDLDVSDDTNLNNVNIEGNLTVSNIKFPDNTIQTTAYNPNITSNKLPNYYGKITFDNNATNMIYSPQLVFDNISSWNDNDHIIIEFYIFEYKDDNSKVYSGNIICKPKLFTSSDVINNISIPSTYTPYLSIRQINSMNSSDDISIITRKNNNNNTATLQFSFKGSSSTNVDYYINSSIKLGSIININNITIANIDNNLFSSN